MEKDGQCYGKIQNDNILGTPAPSLCFIGLRQTVQKTKLSILEYRPRSRDWSQSMFIQEM